MKIEYQGKDITGAVAVKAMSYIDRAGGEADQLDVTFSDPLDEWAGWAPEEGDEIRITDESLDTGAMYVDATEQRSGTYVIGAVSANPSLRSNDWRAMQNASLPDLAQQCAQRHGLTASIFAGVPRGVYGQMAQNGQTDLEWLGWLAMLNSCAVKVYNNRINVYHEPTQEQAAVSRTNDVTQAIDWHVGALATRHFASCTVSGNGLTNTFRIAEAGRAFKAHGLPIGVYADAERFARGMMRSSNKYHVTGHMTLPYDSTLAAGEVVALTGAGGMVPGLWFVDRTEHQPLNNRTVLLLRKPLDGY